MSRDEIILADLFSAVVRRKLVVVVIMLVVTALAVFAAYSMTPIYRASVLLAPVTEEGSRSGGLARLASSLGGLANIAGVSVGGSGAATKEEALATLQSRAFTERFIARQELLPALFASRWDAAEGQWLAEYRDSVPRVQDGYFRFNEARSLSEDRGTGFVTLSIEWPERDKAAEWANLLVEQANEHLRQEAIREAQESIQYLHRELEKTSVVGVRQGIYALVQQQINKIMLANVRDEYAFKILDPAYVPNPKAFVKPRRTLMIVLGFIVGTLLGMVVALIQDAYSRRGSG